MNEFRQWLTSGRALSKFLNIFETLLADDRAGSQCDGPDDDVESKKTIDYIQLREFRQEMWAKRKLGALREQDWFPDCGKRLNDVTSPPVSMVSNDLTLCAAGVVLYEYH